ncbi:MAG TPA: PxKF domain-containing protein, partial [Gaiellaceae bacterium]
RFEGDAANGQSAATAFAIDQTPPTVAAGVPADGAVYTSGTPVPAAFTCADSGSGVAACDGTVAAGANLDTSSGAHTFTVHATDNVGHETTLTRRYVVYPFRGFFSPVANPPAQNAQKAGSAVPVKFSLGGNRGLGIFAAGYPRSVPVSCTTGAPTGSPAAASGALQYDASSQQYTFVWKTDKAYAGRCRELQLRFFDDLQPRVAGFRFT